jgi:hypothetical protein
VIRHYGPLEGIVSRQELVEVQNKQLDEFHLKDHIEKVEEQLEQGKLIESMNLTGNIHAAKLKQFMQNPVKVGARREGEGAHTQSLVWEHAQAGGKGWMKLVARQTCAWFQSTAKLVQFLPDSPAHETGCIAVVFSLPALHNLSPPGCQPCPMLPSLSGCSQMPNPAGDQGVP